MLVHYFSSASPGLNCCQGFFRGGGGGGGGGGRGEHLPLLGFGLPPLG